MSSPFVGEIRVVGFSYAPKGWATCDGQSLAIRQNTALFALLGISFGGNGTTNFNLPNLQAKAPICAGNGAGLTQYSIGDTGGAQTVTITQQTTPAHTHTPFMGDAEPAIDTSPAGDLYAGPTAKIYGPVSNSTTFGGGAMQILGNNQPHDNMAPYVTLIYAIALVGIFPARN